MGEEISAKFERSYIAIFSQFRLVVVFLLIFLADQ